MVVSFAFCVQGLEHGGERKESMWEKDSGATDLSGVGEYAPGSGVSLDV